MNQSKLTKYGTQLKVVSKNGKKTRKNEMGWKESISIASDETVKFEFKGVYMFHCHILEHEDNGMMGEVMVN
ncbi:multicopper oxidase domain-containing protein [Exiguobacterium chiriqhucha]|uniref:multicopper oxidase domain-containing protein n=1 Tax=Exiguobacterium chiriqhucha TaxID=1385984 RepID=UPI0038B716C4